LEDSLFDVLFNMSGGNPGSLSVMSDMMKETQFIDPENILGGLGPILFMDTLGIYESRIWMLYKDVCKENLSHTLAMLRAVQLGLLAESTLDHAIDNCGFGVDVDEMVLKVIDKIPSFNAI
jgi:hypothetical protein